MKLIIFALMIITSVAHSAYIPKDKVGDCSQKTIYLKPNKCPGDCIKIPSNYNCNYKDLVPKTQMKEDIETCADEADCQSKVSEKTCSTGDARAVYTLEPNEVYCTWERAAYIVDNETKKASFESKELKRKNRDQRKARGRVARQKCKDALDYVAGGNLESELTEEQVDAMQAAFAEIFQALQANRPGKALRLINGVTDPTYAEMKENLIEILQ